MKIEPFLIVFIVLIQLIANSCIRNSNKEDKKNLIAFSSNNEILNIPYTKYENTVDTLVVSEIDVIIPENIIGTYLSEPYLNNLNETKSHIISINRVHTNNDIPNSIDEIIVSDKVLFIYNLHEGTTHKISSITNNSIVLESNSVTPSITIGRDCLYLNNVKYIKITDDITPGPRNKIGVKHFITNVIFDNKIYVNEENDELFRLENDNIIYKNVEYDFSYSYVFQNKNYDKLSAINRSDVLYPLGSVWIELKENEIKIYTIKIPEGFDGFDVLLFSEYILEDILKEK